MTAVPLSVSVSIILKNATRTLEGLLRSLQWESVDPLDGSGDVRRRFCFDEIIFVDTGSDDGTYQALGHWLGDDIANSLATSRLQPGAKHVDLDIVVDGTRFVFARFGWTDRFHDARNYSFELSKADVRGYLDADDSFQIDEQGSKARHLKRIFAQALQKDPATAEFSFIYQYDLGTTQKHPRWFVWNRGFVWEGWIHEACKAVPEMDAKRGIGRGSYKVHDTGLVIGHDKSTDEVISSVERNQRIAIAAYEAHADPDSDVDNNERARMAYHLAEYHRMHPGDRVVSAGGVVGTHIEVSEHFYLEAIDQLTGTNYHAMSLQGLAQLHLDAGNQTQAVHWAGALAGHFPELLTGAAMLFLAHNQAGHWDRTATLYREMRDRLVELRARNHGDDVWLTKGLLLTHAARALAEVDDDMGEAVAALAEIPQEIARHSWVRQSYGEANTLIMRKVGLKTLKDMVDYLVWNCEASKALDLLDTCVPMAIRRFPAVARMRAEIVQRMHHLKGWKEYQAAYASIPADDFSPTKLPLEVYSNFVRVQTVVDWARALPSEGGVVRVLSVGFHAGMIEQLLLEANARIHVTVADVAAAQTSQGWLELQRRFPGRVTLYTMESHHYDWGRVGGLFDAAVLFEVIEHVPSDLEALEQLHRLLTSDGLLFLSTPITERWVEPYLTQPPPVGPSWYGHVRGYDFLELRDALWTIGFDVDVLLEGNDNVFTCRAKKTPAPRKDFSRQEADGSITFARTVHSDGPRQHIGIFVPSTPTPFDALSLDEGFLGGSEEAVIHLAKHLADLGHTVEVFAPTKRRDNIPRIYDNVTYRDVNEFPTNGLMGGAQYLDVVLFWRCPGVFNDPNINAAPYKKLLWLHDAYYNVPGGLYARPDAVLTLSEHHQKSVQRVDRAAPETKWKAFANGILDEQFPLWDPAQRDLKKVIYASSPDRGLETLLEIWPAVRLKVPDATLDIYYDWSMIKRHKPGLYKHLMEKLGALADLGVVYHGGVSQPVLHEAMRRAGIWAYPNTGDVETFCITAVKALATGLDVIATDAGALPEVLNRPCSPLVDGAVDLEAFCAELVAHLLSPALEGSRLAGRQDALQRYSWKTTAKRLHQIVLDLKRPVR